MQRINNAADLECHVSIRSGAFIVTRIALYCRLCVKTRWKRLTRTTTTIVAEHLASLGHASINVIVVAHCIRRVEIDVPTACCVVKRPVTQIWRFCIPAIGKLINVLVRLGDIVQQLVRIQTELKVIDCATFTRVPFAGTVTEVSARRVRVWGWERWRTSGAHWYDVCWAYGW